MVTGRCNPTMANSALVDWPEEMVTDAPDAVSLAWRVALDPTVTLPKVSVAGLTSSCSFGLTPFPVRFISGGETTALLVTVTREEVCPTAVGVKITGNRTLAPGLTSAGKDNSPNEKASP